MALEQIKIDSANKDGFELPLVTLQSEILLDSYLKILNSKDLWINYC